MRAMFVVTGTTVTTPRPKRAAVTLAPSLLTTTAGRRLLASAPRTGSRSTRRISPRRIGPEAIGPEAIGPEAIADDHVPGLGFAGLLPLGECVFVRRAELSALQ